MTTMTEMTEKDKDILEALEEIEEIFAKALPAEEEEKKKKKGKKEPKLGGHISLFLLENTQTGDNPITIYKPAIDIGIDTEMLIFAKEYLSSVIESIQKDGLPEYNPDWGEGTFKMNSRKIKTFPRIYKCISGQGGCATYDMDKVKEDKLKAWILRFGVTVKGRYTQIYLFQRFQPAKMLGSKKRFSMFVRGGRFYLATEKIYSLSQEMDFLLLKGTFIITKTFSFEKVFGYEVFYKEMASKMVDDLVVQAIPELKCIDIDRSNAKYIKEKITDNTPLARRIHSAQTNEYYKEIDFDKLVALDKRYDLKLKLNHEDKIWEIKKKPDLKYLKVVARVLNDDYEISQLTLNEYIALSKRPAP